MSSNLYDKLLNRGAPFFLFAGPCVIESRECVFKTAQFMKEITERLGVPYVFKASFDKANRTSVHSYRGPGIDKGLEILSEVKQKFGVAVITDIHAPDQADRAAAVVDILQIPAFLCRQTDLLIAAAKTGLPVNIKKAQFLTPADMGNVVGKMVESGNGNIFLCERGTSFGYNNLVVDMTGIFEMKKFGYPIVFDATHSVQKPGGKGESTGGNREYIPCLTRAAAAAGVEGFFMEVHPEPDKALSDAANMIALRNVEQILSELVQISALVKSWNNSKQNIIAKKN